MLGDQENDPPKAALDLPSIPRELLEQFADEPITAEAIQDAATASKKAIIEGALGAELGARRLCQRGRAACREMQSAKRQDQ